MRPSHFGKYEVVRSIAVGGMGEVYLARAPGLAGFEKLVALKVIRHDLVHNRDFVDALVAEAKLAVRLHHTNITQVFDLGLEGERYYLAMEYVDGLDVFRMVTTAQALGTPIPVAASAYIAAEIASGADYAHNRNDESGQPLGIIHRDLNPHNVLVGYGGEVKITDFGIAKVRAHAKTTAAGVIKGKLTYLSPEQARAERVDQRADVFGIGIVLYETLTGQKLYQRDADLSEVLARVKAGNFVRPRKRRRDIPKSLEKIVITALAPNVNQRYQSAEALREALLAWLHGDAPEFGRRDLETFMEKLKVGTAQPVVLEPTLQKPRATVAPRRLDPVPSWQDADTNPILAATPIAPPPATPVPHVPPARAPIFRVPPSGPPPGIPMNWAAPPPPAAVPARMAAVDLDSAPTRPRPVAAAAPPVASPQFGAISTVEESGATSRMTPDQVRAAAAWVVEMSGQHPALTPEQAAPRGAIVSTTNGSGRGLVAVRPKRLREMAASSLTDSVGPTALVSSEDIQAIQARHNGPNATPAGGSQALRHTPPLGNRGVSHNGPGEPLMVGGSGHTVPIGYAHYTGVPKRPGLSLGARLLLGLGTVVLVLGAAAMALILTGT